MCGPVLPLAVPTIIIPFTMGKHNAGTAVRAQVTPYLGSLTAVSCGCIIFTLWLNPPLKVVTTIQHIPTSVSIWSSPHQLSFAFLLNFY
jgi:hypothetical protein